MVIRNIIENTPEGGDYVVTCCLDSEERGKPETEPESGSEEEQNQTKNEGEKGQSTKDQGTECQKRYVINIGSFYPSI
jgi:hypothetical protein